MSTSNKTNVPASTQHPTKGRRAHDLAKLATAERAKIEAAITQLLTAPRTEGARQRSVSELARIAGVKRWVLTHKHIDLKDQYQEKVQRQEEIEASLPAPQKLSKEQTLQNEITRLRGENAELHELVTFYAHTLHALGMEYYALASRQGEGGNIIPLPMRTPRPGQDTLPTGE